MHDCSSLFVQETHPAHLQKAAEFIHRGKNVILAMPPRSGKTSLATAYAKSLTDQGKKVLYITYSRQLGEMVCRDCGCEVVERFDNLGKIGKSYDVILVDDILKNPDDLKQPNLIEKLKSWFDSILLYNPEARVVVFVTRFGQDDFMGCYPDWDRLAIPAIKSNEDGSKQSYWPEEYSLERLDEIRRTLNPEMFKWLYQQGYK